MLLISCLGELTGGGLLALDGADLTLVQEDVAWFDSLDERNAWRGRARVTGRPSVGLPQ